MSEKTFIFAIGIFMSFFILSQIAQIQVVKRKKRNNSLLKYQKSKWRISLNSAIISFIFSIIILSLVQNSEMRNLFISKYRLEFDGIYFALVAVFLLSLTYIYGIRKGEKYIEGLKPIIRDSIRVSVLEKPYTTLTQSLDFSTIGSRLPSKSELMEIREHTKDYASSKAQWLLMYILYLLILSELLLVIIIVWLFSDFEIIVNLNLFKYIIMILTIYFIPYLLFSIVIHKIANVLLNVLRYATEIGKSSSGEWVLLVLHTIVFYLLIAIIIYAIILFT